MYKLFIQIIIIYLLRPINELNELNKGAKGPQKPLDGRIGYVLPTDAALQENLKVLVAQKFYARRTKMNAAQRVPFD